MSMHVFVTDREYQQSAIDLVARLVFEKASDIMQGGNLALLQAEALNTLSFVALHNDLSNTVINTYFTILDDENKKSDLGAYHD